ncbi:MAG: hypothetical protein KBD24_00505 [Candidatus Pacebacteria bacterium]|nr:hypothetical protein [Candidatus Paceibacterota bacterium]
MRHYIQKGNVIVVCAVFLLFFLSISTGHAQTTDQMIVARRAQLEAQLANLEKLIEQQQVLLSDKRTERVSLERDLDIIDMEIKKARLAIRAQEVTIANLESEISDKHATILEISEKIDMEKESLASLLRRTAEIDDLSLVEIVFSEKSFSEFFEEIDDFESVKLALQASFAELEGLRTSHEQVKQTLEGRKETEGELRKLQQLQRGKLESQEAEKARILKTTKGEEASYQQLITKNEKSATQIRSELFELRGSSAINLGDAIEFANFAGTKTGVRPALILGVLKQETRLGEFLGNGSWAVDMHPTRDRPLFQIITKTLGLNANNMPVSAAPSYGYGGAMGPAQFIPSTWACYGGYVNTLTGGCSNRSAGMSWDEFWAGPWEYRALEDRLRVVRGKQSPSNPWDNQDAFIAAGILMKDNGADEGTLSSERTAALRYFAGWGNAGNPAYAFYGDGVMEHAAYFQKQIDTLKSLSQ